MVTNHATSQTATYHYDPTGERSEKLVTGAWGVVHEARYSVDASFEVDTLHDTHEVHVFVGSRRVATSKRTGLGNAVASGEVTQVRFYHPDPVGTNSISSVLSAAGHSASRAYLDPFGEKQAGTGSDPRHLFTDQELQRRYRLARIAVGIDTSEDGSLEASEEVRSYTLHYTDKTSHAEPENPPFSQLAAIQRTGEDGEAILDMERASNRADGAPFFIRADESSAILVIEAGWPPVVLEGGLR